MCASRNTSGIQGSRINTEVAGNIYIDGTYNNTYNNVIPGPPETNLPTSIRFRYQPLLDHFIGREKELKLLNEKLCIDNPRVTVVFGLGGIGKTYLVKKFIEKNTQFHPNILWMDKKERGIKEEFKILAESTLGISVNVKKGKEKDFRCILGMIFDKLPTAQTLLVLDNVDKADFAEIVRDVVSVDIKPHILITSRIHVFSESVNFLKLEIFSSVEALHYISKKLDGENDIESLEDKNTLADTLKNLPLALHQATSYIKFHRNQSNKNENYNIRKYIADFNKCPEQILSFDLFKYDFHIEYKETTLTTWKVTMNAISECEPHGQLALRILRIIAYFDKVDIIREIFFNLKGLSNDTELNKGEVISAMRLIINYSMVEHYEHQSVLSIHQLLQEVIKIQLSNERKSEAALRDGLHLISQMEGSERFELCLEHGISVYLSALRFRELVIEFAGYPSMILQNLDKSGKYIQAFRFATEINEKFTAILGENHPSTIRTKYDIAGAYGRMGNYIEALQMYKEVLKEEKQILQEHYLHIISTKYNIARSYGRMGKYSEALQMYEKVFKKRKIILGKDHPDTIRTEHDIAHLYSRLGKYNVALQRLRELWRNKKLF